MRKLILISLICLFLVGGVFGEISCGKAPEKAAIPETPKPTEEKPTTAPPKEIGKTLDNPVPLGTPLRVEHWSGTQEITVLKAEFREAQPEKALFNAKLSVDIKIKALQNTEVYARDFKVVGSKGIVYGEITLSFADGSLNRELIGGASTTETIKFSIPPDDSPEFILIYSLSPSQLDYRLFALE